MTTLSRVKVKESEKNQSSRPMMSLPLEYASAFTTVLSILHLFYTAALPKSHRCSYGKSILTFLQTSFAPHCSLPAALLCLFYKSCRATKGLITTNILSFASSVLLSMLNKGAIGGICVASGEFLLFSTCMTRFNTSSSGLRRHCSRFYLLDMQACAQIPNPTQDH